MKTLLTITALIEGATGLALAAVPGTVIPVLLGMEITEPPSILVYRIGGVALFALALACWLFRNGSRSLAMVKVMAGYNLFSLLLFLFLVLVKGIQGPGLWPAFLLHTGLLAWCWASLQKR